MRSRHKQQRRVHHNPRRCRRVCLLRPPKRETQECEDFLNNTEHRHNDDDGDDDDADDETIKNDDVNDNDEG